MSLPSTGGWLGGGWMTGNNPANTRRISSVTVYLNAGLNAVQLLKGVNYGELDYITITPRGTTTPSIPELSIQPGTTNSCQLSWPVPAAGYTLQRRAGAAAGAWADATNPVAVAGNLNFVVVPAAGESAFFRLFP